MSKRMKKNLNFLLNLRNAKTTKQRRRVLKGGGSKGITTLSEVAKNVLGGRINLSPKQKRRLCKAKRILRRMASRKENYKKKTKLLMKGGLPVIPLLMGIISPIIGELIASRLKKSKK